MGDATRWSGKDAMLGRFNEICNEMIDAADHPDSNITVSGSKNFASKIRKYPAMMAEIDSITKSLQQRGRTLSE